MLWGGRIVAPAADDANGRALQAFNDAVAADDRVDSVILPAFDGSDDCPQAVTVTGGL